MKMSDSKEVTNTSDPNSPGPTNENNSLSNESTENSNDPSSVGEQNNDTAENVPPTEYPETQDATVSLTAAAEQPCGTDQPTSTIADDNCPSSQPSCNDAENLSAGIGESKSTDVAGEAEKAAEDNAPSSPSELPQYLNVEEGPNGAASKENDTTLPPESSDSTGAVSKILKDGSESEGVEGVKEVSSPTTSTGTPGEEKAPQQSVYHVKWIKFNNSLHAVITQNENGPCPLLAIMNVLLLERRVKLPAMMEMVTSGQLMEYLGDCIFEHAPKNISPEETMNYEQNMHDAMAVFHKLQTGLDVNVKFTGVKDFEYTPECIVFDLLGIQLYHGWLVDPQNLPQVTAIGNNSYNQLVERIITQKNSNDQDQVTEALISEEFLQTTASQLTYHGLSEIAGTVAENQLCVFFRNNHFSTLYKHKDELFVLVTDQGFLTESHMVWETLSNVEGDGHFVDTNFHTFRKPESSLPQPPASAAAIPANSEQQIDHDYMVALSLQEASGGPSTHAPPSPLSDHELAVQLQEEENQRAAAAAAAQQQQQGAGAGAGAGAGSGSGGAAARPSTHTPAAAATPNRDRNKSNSDCAIL